VLLFIVSEYNKFIPILLCILVIIFAVYFQVI